MQNVNKWDRKNARNTFSVIVIIVICLSFVVEITISIHVDQHSDEFKTCNPLPSDNRTESTVLHREERTDVN